MRQLPSRAVVVLIAVVSAVTVLAPLRSVDAAPAAVYVSPVGDDAAAGTFAAPVRTIMRGVSLVAPGGRVIVRPGTYREKVTIADKAVRLLAAPGGPVMLDGARPIDRWTAQDGAWVARWRFAVPVVVDPVVDTSDPMAKYLDLAYRNGVALRQVATRGELAAGTFYVDPAAQQIWVGDDPTGQLVEASDLTWGLRVANAPGTVVRGFQFRRFATSWNTFAAVRLHSDAVTFADCVVAGNSLRGVSVIGARVSLHRIVVRSNAYQGVNIHRSSNVEVRQSTIVGNNAERFGVGESGAGVKITASSLVRLSDNDVAANLGVGIWTDLSVVGATVVRNLIEYNERAGVLVELSARSLVFGNVVISNGAAGVKVLESNDIDVWNNALRDNYRAVFVQDGPRETLPDPLRAPPALWDVVRVRVVNNTMGVMRPGTGSLFGAEDWTARRTALSMRIAADTNAFWRAPGVDVPLSRWAQWPLPNADSADLVAHQTASGLDSRSVASRAAADPYARNVAAFDYRGPVGSVGTPATITLKRLLALEVGAPLPLGPPWSIRRSPDGVGVSVS